MNRQKLPIVSEHGRYSDRSTYQTKQRLLGRSPGTHGEWSQETKDAVLNLHFRGATNVRIAEKLQLPEKAVETFISKMRSKSWQKYPVACNYVPGPTRECRDGTLWNRWERELVENPHGRSISQLAQLIGRSTEDVILHCRSAGGFRLSIQGGK